MFKKQEFIHTHIYMFDRKSNQLGTQADHYNGKIMEWPDAINNQVLS